MDTSDKMPRHLTSRQQTGSTVNWWWTGKGRGTVEHQSGQGWRDVRDSARNVRIPGAASENPRRGPDAESDPRLMLTPTHAASMRRSVHRGWQRLGFRRQFVMLLVAATLLSTLGTVAAAYFGARSTAIDAAQARIVSDVRVATQVLGAHGHNVTARDGNLFTDDGYRLNGDNTVMDQITAMTGDGAAVYAMDGYQLTGVTGNVGARPGSSSRIIGDTLNASIYQAMFRDCVTDQQGTSCEHAYHGIASIHGVTYITAISPLNDAQGTPTGVLVVATPLDRIEAPLRALIGVLLLIGLTLTIVFVVVGHRLAGPVSRRTFSVLSDGLDHVTSSAGQLGRLAHAQVQQSTRQTTIARSVLEDLRTLGQLAHALEHGVSNLRESASQLWADMSYPGAAPGFAANSRGARQVAVAASQLGGAADQANALCQSLRTHMNQIIAQAGVMAESGGEAETHARELAESLRRIEEALGNGPPAVASPRKREDAPAQPELERPSRRIPAVEASLRESGTYGAVPRDLVTSAPHLRAADQSDAALRLGQPPRVNPMQPGGQRISHAPRAPRPGDRAPRNDPHGSGLFRTGRHPSVSSPRMAGGWPHATGRHPTPWFSDEQNLANPFRQTGASPTPDGGSPPGPIPAPDPGERPMPRTSGADWMNDQS